ncbi:WW domain containing protein [Nitzschia inconspicua]|uniref:WW domain containing protein n=1 Tax=Nitzschia inconspicua TaxID=303405 RepID=A0A9K3PT24_9STRA|nr:WW domain containing protein [Nitzschia inconspicua]
MVKFQSAAVLLAIAATSWRLSTASSGGQGGYGSYSGYNQYQQPQQQHGQWYSPANQASSYQQQQQQQPETIFEELQTQDNGSIDEKPALPNGWVELFDPNSGEYYYYHEESGTTTWDRPEPPESAEGLGASSPEQQTEETPSSNVQHEFGSPSDDRESSGSYGGYGTSPGSNESPEKQEPPKDDAPENPTSWGDGNIPTGDLRDQRDQSNSTDSFQRPLIPEEEPPKPEDQQPPPQQQSVPPGWGIPSKPEDRPSQPAGWGVVPKPPEWQGTPQERQPPLQQNVPPSSNQPPHEPGRWGMPSTGSDIPRHTQQQQPPQQQSLPPPVNRPMDSLRPPPQSHGGPQQNGPQQNGPPPGQRLPPQRPPPNVPRQYQQQTPPYGQYNPNAPQGYGQYNPNTPQGYGQYNPYGQQYGRAYANGPQQPQQSSTGQLVSQGLDEGASAVREALSSAWTGILGFSNRTREAVETAREQVATSAAAAGQTLGARGSSFWERAKLAVGSVFESSDPSSQQPYSLSGNPQPPQGSRPPPGYPGVPQQPGRRPPPGYPGGPQLPAGRGAPPGYLQQSGRYVPTSSQPPRYGGGPPGEQQQPLPQQQGPAPGYPPMQPRRDPPYPQGQQGRPATPSQSQYRAPQSGVAAPLSQSGGYPSQQQQQQHQGPPLGQRRPPFPGSPQGGPPRQQQQSRDPWDHPALTGDH